MKTKLVTGLFSLLIIGAIVWAGTAPKEKFAPAKDFPDGALLYVQISDLPEFIKLWNKSELKEKYLKSTNFNDLQRRHLGIKLQERWTEMSEAVGFPLDWTAISNLAENKAAVALYDIGKLDLVFVAPMNENLFSLTMFSQHAQNFEAGELEDGTKYYFLEARVDRERQKQKLIFASIKGRFVLATGERLFLRTVAAINGKQRLHDEVYFKNLTARTEPHLATIWVNQEKLNSDYYFKRYFLISKLEDLLNIQAGIFNLDIDQNGLRETREFLLEHPPQSVRIPQAVVKDLTDSIPANVPYFRLQPADDKRLGEAVYETLFDRQRDKKKNRKRADHWSFSEYRRYYEPNYYYLDSDFDQEIDQAADNEILETEAFPTGRLSLSIEASAPSAILTAVSPTLQENPFFVEFRKIAIIHLTNPGNFLAVDFETNVAEALKNQVANTAAKFAWTSEGDLRVLQVPLLGWEICYRLQGNKILISNSFEFLRECSATDNKAEFDAAEISDLTVIRPENRQQVFDAVMKRLADDPNDFFTGNIAGFLDAISEAKQIEIRRKAENNFLSEEILIRWND
jgi:hypothetical protein